MNAIDTMSVAASLPTPLIPENAPFSAAQRAWLNGFLAGLYGGQAGGQAAAPAAAEDFPWHDPALELPERLSLAEGRPLPRRLMAAMAQLDCGQCGYQCQTYAEALAEGRESSASLCVPGAKPTMRTLKAILAEAPAPVPVAGMAAEPAHATAPVRVLSAERLTAEGSAKDVRHVVIDLAGTGLSYQPGDSLSLACPNDPALVEACIAALGATGDEPVGEHGLRHALTHTHDIARPHDRVTDLLGMTAADPAHAAALRALSDGLDGAEPADADLLDLLEAFPSARPPLADLVRALPSLKPRLYSIASSQAAVGEQVHLCVSAVRTQRRARVRSGVASVHLADRAHGGSALQAAIHVSPFRLPTDPAIPVIMVGPGTGIAPFRAFLQHRAASGISAATGGRAWLFFGDQHAASDFLYRTELEQWQEQGVLSRLDLAFSRDQTKKIYVQDRMSEQAAELWTWLREGGHFYVCGDASRMARDVDETLRRIAMRQGGMDQDQARDWIVALARQGRYQRDVY